MAMNRRDFLKSAALTVAAGMVMGPTALAKEKTESVAEDGKDILNWRIYNTSATPIKNDT